MWGGTDWRRDKWGTQGTWRQHGLLSKGVEVEPDSLNRVVVHSSTGECVSMICLCGGGSLRDEPPTMKSFRTVRACADRPSDPVPSSVPNVALLVSPALVLCHAFPSLSRAVCPAQQNEKCNEKRNATGKR